MEETNRLRIVRAAQELFYIRGYKSVTISGLADKLGMSKKTIYQYFSGKEEIAAAVIEDTLSRIDAAIRLSEYESEQPLQALRHALEQVKKQIAGLSPLFLEDVQKLLPGLWQRIEQFRAGKIGFIERLLQRAQEAGLAKDISPRLAMVIFLEATQALVKPDALARHGFPMTDVLDALVDIFCTGVMQPEGAETNAGFAGR
ncbi:TetR/AcrR family transcriptional regulator [Paenibacillus humicola]|uniref:TetR/AcrR family transcriptional regulator n=1 Tax=Paenibacillus humicola TaxID=3110540 RepID=UPI00237B0922|nr:TetR/AcrR family transcriptional regulator [Paenibacillus humicola]